MYVKYSSDVKIKLWLSNNKGLLKIIIIINECKV